MRSPRSVCFGDREEGVGLEEALAGVAPADQRLEAGEGAGGELDLRLEEGGDLAAVEALHQRGEERLAALDLAAEVLAEVADGAGAGGLGGAECYLGVGERAAAVGGVVGEERDAHARGEPAGAAVEGEGLFERGLDAGGDHRGVVRLVELGRDDDEGVLAEAGGEVPGAQPLADAAGGEADDLVGGARAEGLAQAAEAVELDAEDGRLRGGAAGAGGEAAEVGVEAGGVGQAGQRVVQEPEAGLAVRLGGLGHPVRDAAARRLHDAEEECGAERRAGGRGRRRGRGGSGGGRPRRRWRCGRRCGRAAAGGGSRGGRRGPAPPRRSGRGGSRRRGRRGGLRRRRGGPG